jgi:hypothetical protein
VTAAVFPPDDEGGAAIHDEVRPFVDELHVVEGRLREKRSQRQKPHQHDAGEGKGITADVIYDIFTHFLNFYLHFCCKSKNNFIFLQANYEECRNNKVREG